MNRKHIHQFDSPKNPSKTKTKILNLNEMKNSFKSLPSSWKNNPPESISKILSFYEYKEQNKQYHIEKQLEELQTIERLSHETANLSQEYYYQHKLLLYYNKNIKYNAMKQLYKYSQLNRKTSISFKRATRVYLKKLLDSWKVQLQQNRLQDKIYMISKLYLYRRLLLNSIIEIKTRAFNHKYIKQKLLSCLHEKYHSKLSEVLATLRLVKKRKAFMRKLTSSHTKIVVLEYFHNLKQHRKSLKAIRRITESFYLKMYYAFLYCMKVNKMKKQNTFRDNRKLMRKSFMRFILQVYKKKRFRLLQSKLLHKASRNPLRVLKLIAFRNLYQFIECKRSNMQDNEYYTRKHLNYQILKSLSQWKQYTNTLSYNRQEMKLPSMNFWLRFKKSIIAKRFRNCFQLNIFIQAKQHYNLFLSRKYINRFYSWLERLFKHHPLVPNTSRYKSLISYRSNKSLYLLTRLKSWYYYSLHNTIRNKRSNTFKAYKYWRLKRLRYSLKRFQDWMRLLQDVNITIDNSHCYPIYSIILNRIIPYSYSRKRRVIKGLHNHVNKFRSITLINQSNKFHCKYQLKKSIGLWKVYITKVMNHKQVLKESNQVYHYRLLKLSLRHWNEFINLKYHPRRVNCHDILLTSQLRRIQYIIVIWIQRQLHLKTFNNWYDIALQYYLHKRLSLTIHKLRRYLTSKRRFTTSIQSGILLYNNLHQSNVMKVMKQKKIQYQRIDYNSNIALAHQLFKLVHLIKECFHIWKRKFSKCLNILKLSIRSHNITLKKRFFNTMVLYMKSKQRQDSLIQFAYISRYEYQIGRVIDMLKIFVINKTKDKDIVCKHHYDIVHLMNRNRPERRYIHHLHDITQLKKLYYIKYIDMIKKNIYQTILSHSMISIGKYSFLISLLQPNL